MRGEEDLIDSEHTDRGVAPHASCTQGAPETARATSSEEGSTQLSSRDNSVRRRQGSLSEIAGESGDGLLNVQSVGPGEEMSSAADALLGTR
jgi:hypothetical protein